MQLIRLEPALKTRLHSRLIHNESLHLENLRMHALGKNTYLQQWHNFTSQYVERRHPDTSATGRQNVLGVTSNYQNSSDLPRNIVTFEGWYE